MVSFGLSASGLQILTVRSVSPEANCLPFFDQATAVTTPLCCSKTLPVSEPTCQTRTDLSSLPLASVFPSAQATHMTVPVCPLSVPTAFPAASHNRTVLSLDAVASSFPSGDQAVAMIAPLWPSSVATCFPEVVSQNCSAVECKPVMSGRPGVNSTGNPIATRNSRDVFWPLNALHFTATVVVP